MKIGIIGAGEIGGTRGIDESCRQQPGTPVYDVDRDAAGVKRALMEASANRLPQWRAPR